MSLLSKNQQRQKQRFEGCPSPVFSFNLEFISSAQFTDIYQRNIIGYEVKQNNAEF